MCICICICTCVYMHTHTHVHTYIHAYIHTYSFVKLLFSSPSAPRDLFLVGFWHFWRCRIFSGFSVQDSVVWIGFLLYCDYTFNKEPPNTLFLFIQAPTMREPKLGSYRAPLRTSPRNRKALAVFAYGTLRGLLDEIAIEAPLPKRWVTVP